MDCGLQGESLVQATGMNAQMGPGSIAGCGGFYFVFLYVVCVISMDLDGFIMVFSLFYDFIGFSRVCVCVVFNGFLNEVSTIMGNEKATLLSSLGGFDPFAHAYFLGCYRSSEKPCFSELLVMFLFSPSKGPFWHFFWVGCF